MLKRPKHLPFSVTKQEQVKLRPGEITEVVFKLWCDKTRFCEKHPDTQLLPTNKVSQRWPVYEEYRHYGQDATAKLGEFWFSAFYSCPTCSVAYALCPTQFHLTSFDTFDTSTPERAATLAIAREFAGQVNKHGCGFALFVGPTGPGKSRLACNIIRALEDRDALYVRHGALTAALRATYRQGVEYDDEGTPIKPENPLEITQGVRFLVLDEIGCAALANDERLLLDELLKHRYDQNKPTILISNLPLDQFKEFVGDALADRIRHAAGNGKFIVQFKGESYRRNTGGNYLEGHG